MTLKFADFAVLRLPAESINLLNSVPTDDSKLSSYIVELLARPKFLDALYLASPSLCSRAMLTSKPDTKTSRTVLKYMIRSCSRATPFGLFSGVMPISVGTQHQLDITKRKLKRVTRFDCSFLALVQRLFVAKYSQQQSFMFRPADTLYQVGDCLRYIEAGQHAAGVGVKLAEIELDGAVKAALACCGGGASVALICQQVQLQFAEVAPAEIKAFILSLIDAGVLQPLFQVPLICADLNQQFIRQLLALDGVAETDKLLAASEQLQRFDQQGFVSPTTYQHLHAQIALLFPSVQQQKLLQVDCSYQSPTTCYAASIQADIRGAVTFLAQYFARKTTLLAPFIQQFQTRFRGRYIPLLQILDDENGITWHQTHYDEPIVAGLELQKADVKIEAVSFPLQQILTLDQPVIQLEQLAIAPNADPRQVMQSLPFSMAALVTLFKDADGQEIVYLNSLQGPSAANWLGRFCHLDEQLLQQVRRLLEREAAWSPDVVFAEIVHLPDDRQGNVICRPALREYHIPVMCHLPSGHSIELSDLFVFVEDGFIKLWSKRLAKQVVPRLSCAHNFVEHAFGIYRFMGMLQHQYYIQPRCDVPEYLNKLAHWPRLQFGSVILREEQWRIETKVLTTLIIANQIDLDALNRLQQNTGLDRYVCYAVHDNSLTIDLQNPVLLQLLLDEVKDQSVIVLKESLNHKLMPVVHAVDGAYAHELLLPLENEFARKYLTAKPPQASELDPLLAKKNCISISQISCFLEASPKTIEQILIGSVVPELHKLQQECYLNLWYLQRYANGKSGCHIYLDGEQSQLLGIVVPRLQHILQNWQDGFRLKGLTVTPYAEPIELAQYLEPRRVATMRHAVAEFVLRFLSENTEHNVQARLRQMFLISSGLMNEMIMDNGRIFRLVDSQRQKYAGYFKDDIVLRKNLGKSYISFKQSITKKQNNNLFYLSKCKQYITLIDILKNQENRHEYNFSRIFHEDTIVMVISFLINNLFMDNERDMHFILYDYMRRFYLTLIQNEINDL